MLTNRLAVILQELGKTSFIPLKDLAPDKNNTCLLHLPGGIDLQLESDDDEKNLIVACKLPEILAGPYRQNIFREALKANNAPYPRFGDFARRNDQLVLFELLNYQELNGELLAEFLQKFVAKALSWYQAITNNLVPTEQSARSSGGGLFGLMP